MPITELHDPVHPWEGAALASVTAYADQGYSMFTKLVAQSRKVSRACSVVCLQWGMQDT